MATFDWHLRPYDADHIAVLSRDANVPPLLSQLLINRGITNPTHARAFLEAKRTDLHDPAGLPGVVEAAARIVNAVRAGRRIVIYGDYDVDGVCGTSVLWACLRLAGASDIIYYIPHRVEEGYGVNAEALRKLATEDKAALIVTVDCGISAIHEARLARELGVEFIVTDHHHIGPELPEADVLVHPSLPGSSYPFQELCGAGVAFKLAWQICKTFGDGKRASPHMREFLTRAINLVALATVADIVPLTDENRIFVRHGLRGMVDHPSVGLKALLQVSNSLGRDRLSTAAIGFGLAPRINAAGRMEFAMKAVELLTTDDPELAAELAQFLDDCNTRRKEVEWSIVSEAHRMIDDQGGLGERGAIVLGKAGWHAGVIGIVASRLVDAYHRPTIVLSLGEDIGQGSGRSIPGFDLYEAISACSEGLLSFGGHKAAAGLKLPVSLLPEFTARFDQHCRAALTADQLRREILIDAEVNLGVLTTRLIEQLDDLEPYGMGNPRPILAASGVTVVGEPRLVGAKKNHLQVRFTQGSATVRAIGWNMAARAKEFVPEAACDVAFHPEINVWHDRREVQLNLKDVRVCKEAGHAMSH